MRPLGAVPACGIGRDRQHGSALVLVVVILGLIAVLATVVARSVAGAAIGLSSARATWQSETDMRTGIELGVATISKLGEAMRSADAFVDLDRRRIGVRVTNERARIDLNRASAATLAKLLETNGVSDTEAAALAAAITEWRGGSASQQLSAPREDGSVMPPVGSSAFSLQTESEVKEGPRQVVGTRYFVHPFQLASVPGFSKSLVGAILPLVTVANGSNRIDPLIAPDRVLRALPGISSAAVEAFRAARDDNASREDALKLLAAPPADITADAASGWRIEITIRHQDGRVYRSEGVIAILDGSAEPYQVLYVLDDSQ